MCIISNQVEEVAKTNIFVAVDSDINYQLVVYSNFVDNDIVNNAMILPVPNPSTVEFHDLTKFKNFFERCSSCFYEKNLPRGRSSNTKCAIPDCNFVLPVQNVGSYQVSLAHNIDQLNNIDSSVFSITDDCKHLLNNNYANKNFGFIICKLANSKKEYHPFGYSHFITNTDEIFIPTKHYHAHKSFSKKIFEYVGFSSTNENKDNIKEKWDHNIYLYNASLTDSLQKNDIDPPDEFVWTKKSPLLQNNFFPLKNLKHFEKHKIVGLYKNVDLVGKGIHNIKNDRINNKK